MIGVRLRLHRNDSEGNIHGWTWSNEQTNDHRYKKNHHKHFIFFIVIYLINNEIMKCNSI